MAFFPKDEYQPRRGVAMKVKHPDVERCVGEDRDHRMDKEIKIFEGGEFVMNKALDKAKSSVSKVKTFDRHKGQTNVIEFHPEPLPPLKPRLRPDFPEEVIRTFQHNGAEREKQYVVDRFAHSPGMTDKFSSQKPELFHKHKVQLPPTRYPAGDTPGFRGLGKSCGDSPRGRNRVLRHVYDPLRLRAFTTGDWREGKKESIRAVPSPFGVTVQEHFHYDDGIKLEDQMKPVVRYPRVATHQFPTNYSPQDDIEGFRGLGASDPRHRQTGKHHLEPQDHLFPPPSTEPSLPVDGSREHHYDSRHPAANRSGAQTVPPLPPTGPYYSRNESQIQFSPDPKRGFVKGEAYRER